MFFFNMSLLMLSINLQHETVLPRFGSLSHTSTPLDINPNRFASVSALGSGVSFPRHITIANTVFHVVTWYYDAPVYFSFSNGKPQLVLFFSNNGWTLEKDCCQDGAWLLTAFSCPPNNCWDIIKDHYDTVTNYGCTTLCNREALTGYIKLYGGSGKRRIKPVGHRWIKQGDDLKFDLIDVQFNSDSIKQGRTEPNTIKNRPFENCGDVDFTDSLDVKYIVSDTRSWSHSISFKFNMKQSFTAGFDLFGNTAKAHLSTSFEFGTTNTFSRKENKTKIEHYSFPVVVPARTKLTALATISTVHIDVPYKLVFSAYDDYQIEVPGVWKGVAASDSKLIIKKTGSC